MQPVKVLTNILLMLAAFSSGFGQKIQRFAGNKPIDTTFNQLISHFDELHSYRKDTLRLPNLLVTEKYKVVLADTALHLTKQRRVVTNPFSADKYPLSYSILYRNNLISLFSPGYFACFTIDDWQRNLALEKTLNTKRFKRHWLVDGQLIGLAAGQYWQLTTDNRWRPYKKPIPFGERPKLFEDATYLVYNECNGEFGGRVFFFDKQTKKTYWMESTCAVWVRRSSAGYEVMSSLGHGMGSADKQLIGDPHSLPAWAGKPASRVAATNSLSKSTTLFDLYGVQLFGGVARDQQIFYLAHILDRTCLVSLLGSTFTVVDALFNDGLYTHQPATTNYDGIYVINLDFYGIGRYREVSLLVLKNDKLTLLDWHELHPRF